MFSVWIAPLFANKYELIGVLVLEGKLHWILTQHIRAPESLGA